MARAIFRYGVRLSGRVVALAVGLAASLSGCVDMVTYDIKKGQPLVADLS